MNWKRNRKCLISLGMTFAMLFSTVGTAGATEPSGLDVHPTETVGTESEPGQEPEEAAEEEIESEIEDETELETEDETESETEDETESETEDETEPETEDETEPETEDETEPETEDETESETEDETEEDDLIDDSDDESSEDPENPDGEPSAVFTLSDHEHNWSEDWSYDDNYHWHECTDEDCPVTDNSEKDGYADHIFGDDNVCTECGYTVEGESQLARAATGDVPTYQEAYDAMIALKEEYHEGMEWTNFTPYGSNGSLGDSYIWNGGKVYGADRGVGCAAFAFILSDAAFGNLPARVITKGSFTFADVKVGDILRVNNNSHSVIVLQKSAAGVIVAEGNYNKTVHWGRAMTETEVLAASYIITRYPKDYVSEEDAADTELASESINGSSLKWTLTNRGILTISGNGAMPNYDKSDNLPPWNEYNDKIYTIVVEKGVTSIGAYAFYQSGMMSVTIPGTVTNIGDYAFYDCESLISVTISEGVKTIGERAFQGCNSLAYIDFPASITSLGDGAFWNCGKITRVRFIPGTGEITPGGNLFAQCRYLTSVTLPKTLTKISSGMFTGCSSLYELYIPASVTEIELGGNPFTPSGITDIYFEGSEDTWNHITPQSIRDSMGNIKMHYDEPFPDPFAADPNDPGDFHPVEDEEDESTPANPNTPGDSSPDEGGNSPTNPDGSQNVGGNSSSGRPNYTSSTSSASSSTSSSSSSSYRTVASTRKDGSNVFTTTQKDGTVTTLTTNAAGVLDLNVNLSVWAINIAKQRAKIVSLPITAVRPVQDASMASVITVHTGTEPMKVAIPTSSPTPGTVAVLVKEDGSTEVIKASASTGNSIVALLSDGATVKIVDNSKSYPDVPEGAWFEDAVAFVSARELYYDTAASAFAPNEPMTYGMLLTALARFDGAETEGGAAWYTKSMEWAAARAISNGANPDSNIVCQELINVLWRYAGSPAAADTISDSVDAEPLSDPQKAMNWAVENGIVDGFEEEPLQPQGQITRAQAAQIIMNLIKKITLNPAQ